MTPGWMSMSIRTGIVGCRGFCSQGPLVSSSPDSICFTAGCGRRMSTRSLRRTLGSSEIVDRLLYLDPVSGLRCRGLADNPFFADQERQVLARCGVVDPEDIDHAVALGAYERSQTSSRTSSIRWGSSIRSNDPDSRRRGGAGFPVGLKWAVVAEAPGDSICRRAMARAGIPGSRWIAPCSKVIPTASSKGWPSRVLRWAPVGEVVPSFGTPTGGGSRRTGLGSGSNGAVFSARRSWAPRSNFESRSVKTRGRPWAVRRRRCSMFSRGGEEWPGPVRLSPR